MVVENYNIYIFFFNFIFVFISGPWPWTHQIPISTMAATSVQMAEKITTFKRNKDICPWTRTRTTRTSVHEVAIHHKKTKPIMRWFIEMPRLRLGNDTCLNNATSCVFEIPCPCYSEMPNVFVMTLILQKGFDSYLVKGICLPTGACVSLKSRGF